jgi:peroxiredoxin
MRTGLSPVPVSNLIEGDLAPDFTVDSTMGEFHLDDELNAGPILLLFYMGDFGTMCSWVLLRFKELLPEIEALGVRLLAINTNKVQMHYRFRGKIDLPFHLLSDVDGSVSKAYGTLIDEEGVWYGFSGRGVFLIDTDRKVMFQWVPENPTQEPKYERVMEELRSFAQGRRSSS